MKPHLEGKKPNRKNNPTKIAGKSPQTAYGKGSFSTMHGKAWDLYDTEGEEGKHPFRLKRRAKFVPKGIDPAYPQKNFVKAHYENKGDMSGFCSYMYGNNPLGPMGQGEVRKTPHGYGHKKRSGYLRLSGTPGAYQIGKKR